MKLSKFLNKKFVIRRNIGTIFLESIIGTALITTVLYLSFKLYGNTLVYLAKYGYAEPFELSLLLFPIILVIVLVISFGYVLITNHEKIVDNKEDKNIEKEQAIHKTDKVVKNKPVNKKENTKTKKKK